ncbi:MAG: Hsp70 family protein [Planctomycetota bacterium]
MSDDKRAVTVGIDLGTTWSVIATMDDYGQVQILSNAEGEPKTPSMVMFEEDNPELVVGKVAMQSAKAVPERVVAGAKRQIGKEPPWTTPEMDGKTYRAEDISSYVLRKLIQDAEVALGGDVEVKRAVITVPAYFEEARRIATKNAGELAGLEVMGILDEPVAAAIAYSLDQLGQDQNVVVYDLGGGTFDVTVMRIEGGTVQVLAKGGNAELGGKDWDEVLVQHAAQAYEEEFGEDPTDDPGSYQALYDAALMAKESLSRVKKARITVSANKGRKVVEITRDEFDSLTAGLLDQTKTTLEGILQEAEGIDSWSQVDKVLLVGGSTKMPQVPQMVQQVTGKEPSIELNPDTCVAEGAAFNAFGRVLEIVRKTPQKDETPEQKVTRKELEQEVQRLGSAADNIPTITPGFASSRFYGIRALDANDQPINRIMIQKNDKIPLAVTKTFGTASAGMTEIPIKVLECEREETDPDQPDITLVREGNIVGIPAGLPEGAPVDVTFEFRDDGTLFVRAVETTNGKVCELDAKPAGGMTKVELAESHEKAAALKVS